MRCVGFGRAILLSLGSNVVYPQKHQDNTHQNKINKKKMNRNQNQNMSEILFPSQIYVATLHLPYFFATLSHPIISRTPLLCSRNTRTRHALSLTGRWLSHSLASNLSFFFLSLIFHCILSLQYMTETEPLVFRQNKYKKQIKNQINKKRITLNNTDCLRLISTNMRAEWGKLIIQLKSCLLLGA
jgi:hypothetical protein